MKETISIYYYRGLNVVIGMTTIRMLDDGVDVSYDEKHIINSATRCSGGWWLVPRETQADERWEINGT